MNLGIVGSRTFNDYEKFLDAVNLLGEATNIDKIVSGGAKGADSLAERYADYWMIPKEIFKPDWKKYGKAAGFLRNTDIVANSDVILAFWDGKSRGTKDTIDKAARMKRPTLIIYV